MKLLDLPLKRPVAIIVIFGLAAYLGISTYLTMKYELVPSISIPMVTIQTLYPGASPKEVEDQVTRRIEDAISGVSRIKHVNSSSYENLSIVAVSFAADTDVNLALQDVQRQVNAHLGEFPADVKTPSLNKISLDELPIMQLAIRGNYDSGALYQLVKDTVSPRLSQIPGVGQVTMIGGNAREIKVSLSQASLERYGVPVLLVTQKLGAANIDFPAGTVKDKDGQYVVRIAGKIASLDEMRGLVLAQGPNGAAVRLGDVAMIQDTLVDSRTIFRYDGREAIGVQIVKQAGANAVSVSKAVHAELAALTREYQPHGLAIQIPDDSSIFTLESANDVVRDILLAVLLVGVIMLLFLHDLRNALIVMMAIPTTLLTTLIGMGLLGFTLNLMSLLSLSLVIGILVDDSIVVIENIHRHRLLGKGGLEAARIGAREIGFAAFSVTLVIIVAFLPVSLAGGTIGGILNQFGITLVMATAISLFVSFTLTPMLAAKLGDAETRGRGGFMHSFGASFDRGFGRITDVFQAALAWGVRHKKVTLGVAAGLLVASLGLVASGAVGSEFFVQIDRGEFNVNLELPERVTLEQNNAMMLRIEDLLRNRTEVARVFAKVGYDSATASSSNFKSQIAVALVPRSERRKSSIQVGSEVERELRAIPGIKVKISQKGIIDSSSDPIEYDVIGPNFEDNLKVAESWLAAVKSVQGTGDARISVSNGKPELRVDIDRAKLADLGLSLDMVGASLRNAIAGNSDLSFSEGGTDYAIDIRLDSFDRTDSSHLADLSFANNRGQQVRLGQFAVIHGAFGPTVLSRQDRVNSIAVTAQAIGRSSGTITREILAATSSLPRVPGVEVRPSGFLSMQSESFGTLGSALILSVVLIYAILAILFDSLAYPLAVMFCLPFAMVGGFVSLAVARQTLNIFSIMAIILLMGLAAKNAILLVDRALKNRDQRGMDLVSAFKEAVATRIRPIVMTTAAMVFGMLPVALGLGSAGEMKSAMGIVLIGGLVISMAVTMVIVPVSFLAVDKLRSRVLRPKTSLEIIND
ncbi:MAG TPA: efflux RND transporter permease subunit [Anaeromyxobacteraceae bacterium]|nr:efflux RND transporter permease subunit [Anaeromyxobacteraceae bacterium]